MRKKSVYVTYGRTESGDDLQPLVWWGAKPTDLEAIDVYNKQVPAGVVFNFKTVKASIQ